LLSSSSAATATGIGPGATTSSSRPKEKAANPWPQGRAADAIGGQSRAWWAREEQGTAGAVN
jgi:hypothetical protein